MLLEDDLTFLYSEVSENYPIDTKLPELVSLNKYHITYDASYFDRMDS